jgi:Flp pilus assembly protein TadD
MEVMTVENFRWANDLVEARDPLGALVLLEPALDESQDNLSVLQLAARAYFHSAQLGRAEATFGRILELDPSDHWARHALGRTLERAGKDEQAAPHLRLAAAMNPAPDYVAAAARYEQA